MSWITQSTPQNNLRRLPNAQGGGSRTVSEASRCGSRQSRSAQTKRPPWRGPPTGRRRSWRCSSSRGPWATPWGPGRRGRSSFGCRDASPRSHSSLPARDYEFFSRFKVQKKRRKIMGKNVFHAQSLFPARTESPRTNANSPPCFRQKKKQTCEFCPKTAGLWTRRFKKKNPLLSQENTSTSSDDSWQLLSKDTGN